MANTVGQKNKNKKRNTPIYFNTHYRTEIKLVPIMDYRNLKFFLRVFFHVGSLPNFNFFQCKPPKFFNGIVKFTSQIAWKQIFTTFLTLV